MKKMTLGSLFDGSGGFPLAARMCGIEPVWASEIEPYPIRVTKKNFPNMKHYGDITKMNGAEIEPVDIISFGSPCQDLSVAGLRKGLKHSDKGDDETTRSGLFIEAIRIIKEMRDATKNKYPNIIIWENVVGALSSSNNGDDFWTVLKEIYGITQKEFCIPRLEKWTKSGEILGDGCSLAWRTMDAQFFGVAQRRRRLFLIGCLGNERAGEILFESSGVSRNLKACQTPGKKVAANNGEGSQNTRRDKVKNLLFEAHMMDARIRGPYDVAPTLNVLDETPLCISSTPMIYSIKRIRETNLSPTLDTKGGNPNCNQGDIVILDSEDNNLLPKTLQVRCGKVGGGKGALVQENKAACITQCNDQTIFEPVYSFSHDLRSASFTPNIADPLTRTDYMEPPAVITNDSTFVLNHGNAFTNAIEDKSGALQRTDYKDPPLINTNMRVRRLTPLECCRLQGFPDDWCDGVEGSDSDQYKMWGNGVALPVVYYIMSGIKEVMEDESNKN